MRSPTSALALVLIAGLGFAAHAATPVDAWPQQVAFLDKNAAKTQEAAVDDAAAALPPELAPAAQFQKLFLEIMSGAPVDTWRGEIEKLAASKSQQPVDLALAEISRAWLARLQMADIDTTLRNYYRRNVRFPATLDEIAAGIPENLRKDPWGDPWVYKLATPQGFTGFEGQRYQLGPARYPHLGNLDDAVRHRSVKQPAWTIALRDIAGSKALEFRSDRAGTAVITVIQPGGRVDDCILLYIGDKWALMAGVDQLFAVTF
ncbi:MAG TPA: hypothetical protein VG733_12920 [Chthoniobacteraceae bacterium]|nr:hypothetical protein [Chthoniobacteraceae bacterium]